MKVEFRDEGEGFIHEQHLTFDPRLSAVIELKRRHTDYGARVYEVVPSRSRMCLAADKPDVASLIVYLRELKK